ncbi:MAG TPA: type VI secretion system baseplate subunit TssE [Terriglobales bacterium]|jgi:type VI secretion system protein ImpF
MREPRPITGARAPLFDRLVDADPDVAREPVPLRVLDRPAVVASVAREITRLFNTRSPQGERLSAAGPGWVLDYGVPDFGNLSAASAPDRERYGALLSRILLVFEPRLSQVRIVLEAVPGDPSRLAGAISAELRLGTVREPVSFPLLLQTKTGELHLAPPDAATDASA